jgi:hypothetical protein
MELRSRILLLFCLFFVASGSWAARVDIAVARQASCKVYMAKAQSLQHLYKGSVLAAGEHVLAYEGMEVGYIFNMSCGGWVIMAADDRVTPVLAFSPAGDLDPSKASPAFNWMMESYGKQITYVVANDIPATPEIEAQWQQWLGEAPVTGKGGKSITPMLTCKWDQGTFYNKLCPEDPDGPDGHALTGCVATCMAQLMYYYRYPLQGNGYHGYYSNYGYLSADYASTTYLWDQMENSINSQYNIPMATIQLRGGR